MRCGKWPQSGIYNRAYAAGAFPLNQITLKWYFSMHRWIKSKIRNVSGKIFVLRRALRRLVGGHTRAPTHMLRTFWMFNTTSKMAWWLNHAQHGCAMYNTSTTCACPGAISTSDKTCGRSVLSAMPPLQLLCGNSHLWRKLHRIILTSYGKIKEKRRGGWRCGGWHR